MGTKTDFFLRSQTKQNHRFKTYNIFSRTLHGLYIHSFLKRTNKFSYACATVYKILSFLHLTWTQFLHAFLKRTNKFLYFCVKNVHSPFTFSFRIQFILCIADPVFMCAIYCGLTRIRARCTKRTNKFFSNSYNV